MEEEPMSDGVAVLIFPESVRIFNSRTQAENWYSRKTASYVLESVKDLDKQYYDYQLEQIEENLVRLYGNTSTSNSRNQRIWDMAISNGDRVQKPRPGIIPSSKKQYTFHLTVYQEEKHVRDLYPKQARIILDGLAKGLDLGFHDDDVRALIINLVATQQLKTKQEPFRLFQYYRPRYIEDGFLSRGDQ